jgi:hypothetical protein
VVQLGLKDNGGILTALVLVGWLLVELAGTAFIISRIIRG